MLQTLFVWIAGLGVAMMLGGYLWAIVVICQEDGIVSGLFFSLWAIIAIFISPTRFITRLTDEILNPGPVRVMGVGAVILGFGVVGGLVCVTVWPAPPEPTLRPPPGFENLPQPK